VAQAPGADERAQADRRRFTYEKRDKTDRSIKNPFQHERIFCEGAAGQLDVASGKLLNLSNPVNNRNKEKISARALVLDLFTTGVRDTLSSNDIRKIGRAFGLSDLALRTALTRLRAEGKLSTAGRGIYAAGVVEDPVRERAAVWRSHPGRRIAWDGSWVCAAIKPTSLPRTRWRRTQWALEFNGFRQDETGLWVRPNNLRGGAGRMASDLVALGAADAMLTARMDHVSGAHARRFSALWDRDRLARSHEDAIHMLEHSLQHMGSGEAVAVETLLTGREAIRRILRDPLLPAEIAETATLDRLVACMDAYDAFGRKAWADFMDQL